MIDDYLEYKYSGNGKFTLDEIERDLRDNQLIRYFQLWIKDITKQTKRENESKK